MSAGEFVERITAGNGTTVDAVPNLIRAVFATPREAIATRSSPTCR